MTIRVGSVPYLNVKPLVDWFHDSSCTADVEVLYAVPSELARMLRRGELDVANTSIFECLQNPDLAIIPDISISAYGAVKSVRLFARTPLDQIRSVALDTSSLTSVALTRILLAEAFGLTPRYEHHPPQLDLMLEAYDAGLIIGDLKLFDLHPGTTVYDLGQGWYDLTGLPFVYAAWQARPDRVTPEMVDALTMAKQWGVARLESLAQRWSERMQLPLTRCEDYLMRVMNYDLNPEQEQGLRLFQQKCALHDLIEGICPLQFLQP